MYGADSESDTDPQGFRASTFYLLWLRTVIVSDRHAVADDGGIAGLRELPPDYAAVSEGKPYVSAIKIQRSED